MAVYQVMEQFAPQIGSPLLTENDHFLIKLAENQSEIESAQRLRYLVFKEERGKQAEFTDLNLLDRDAYDDYCLHLLVQEKSTGDLAGTYRIHPGIIARKKIGFYSEQEFQFTGLDQIFDRTLEMGRSCVAPQYRNGTAVSLLWLGIGELRKRLNILYMLGCVSLESEDPLVGYGVYRYLRDRFGLSEKLQAKVTDAYKIDPPPGVDALEDAVIKQWIPPLFKGYLRLGARICGEPALDRDFGCIDFPLLFDYSNLPEKYRKHYRT